MPKYEGMGRSFKFFNGKINYGLLVRFLRGKVGEDWQQVHAEILERIPTDLLEYKDCIQWFVADLVEKKQDGLWDKRAQKYLKLAADEPSHWTAYEVKEFYVDPDSSLLVRVEGYPF